MTRSTTPTVTVSEVMHHGVITTPPQTSLTEVADQMARNRVHCVVVEGLARDNDRQERLVWGILSDLDLMGALAAERLDASAGELAATEIVTVETSDHIEEVARLMTEHQCAHMVVVSPLSREPVGLISSLDVARGVSLSRQLDL
jgi:CBS domain-containing protein